MTVSDMCFEVEQRGFDLRGRPSKAVSDALRWEVRLGRVIQLERGCYRYGDVPRSTDDPWQDHLNHLL